MTSDEGAAQDPRPPRPMWRLAIDPRFGPFFLGRLISTTGMWINNIVGAIIAFEISGSALVVGMVTAAQFLPQTLLAPLSGAMADRGDRKGQLIVGRLVAAAGSAGLAVWIGITGVEGMPGIAPVLLSAVLVGLGMTIGQPAMHALVPALVRPNELASAMSLNTMPFTVARAIGPAAGAFVAATMGPASAFGLAAAGQLVFAALLLRVRARGRARRRPSGDTSVRGGLRYVRSQRQIVLLLIGIAAVSFGADPVLTLSPALADSLGAGPAAVGIMVSAFGVGAGCGIVVVGQVQRWLGVAWTATSGLGVMAVGALLAAFAWSLPAAVVTFAVAGVGISIALPSLSTQLQTIVPDEFRGRVMALWMVSLQGTRPFAAVLGGSVSDAASVEVSLVMTATLVAAAAWICRPRPIG